jgi:hypothetical protein
MDGDFDEPTRCHDVRFLACCRFNTLCSGIPPFFELFAASQKIHIRLTIQQLPTFNNKMKLTIAVAFTLLASALAFAPQPTGTRVAVSCDALFDGISGMDLFDRKKSMYGARSTKDLSVGKISDKSYVPNGLTKAQYEKIRSDAQSKKDANYKKNVKKAGIFTDYTDFYMKRGTDLNAAWKKSVTLGHDMAKTKFDWSGKDVSVNKLPESSNVGGKKVAAKKTFGAKKVAPKAAAAKAVAKPGPKFRLF